jgi:hypothetical protein
MRITLLNAPDPAGKLLGRVKQASSALNDNAPELTGVRGVRSIVAVDQAAESTTFSQPSCLFRNISYPLGA